MHTTSRFIAASIKVKGSIKLKVLLVSVILCGVMCLVLHLSGQYLVAAYFGSVGFGMCCSAIFPLIATLSVEFGIKYSVSQLSNILIAPVLASVCLTGLTGLLMKLSNNVLFIDILLMGGLLGINSVFFLRELSKSRPKIYEKPSLV